MYNDAMDHLSRAQTELNRHLDGTTPATPDQLFHLTSTLDDLKVQADEVHQHRLSFHHGAAENTMEWTAKMDHGKLIEAIKIARVVHKLDILDAKRLVTAYRDRKYAFANVPLKQA